MPRNQPSKQYNHGSDHSPPEENGRLRADRELERGDDHIGSAHKLRDRARDGHDGSDDRDDDEGYDDGYAGYSRIYDEDLEYHAEPRLLTRDEEGENVEDIEDIEDVEDVDIMERLDHDDLTQMDGPDA